LCKGLRNIGAGATWISVSRECQALASASLATKKPQDEVARQ
jgi:hypothetical protein